MNTKTVRIEVVVPVDVTVPADDALPEGTAPVTAAVVGLALRQLATDYNDGRYPFSAELLHEGAARLAGSAAHRALYLLLDVRFGNEMVHDPQWDGQARRSFVVQRNIENATPTLGNVRVVEDGCTAREAVPCATCGGSGEVPEPHPHEDFRMDTRTCSTCDGTGCRVQMRNMEVSI